VHTFWRESFRVRFYDADPRGRITLPALCRNLQVTADQHTRHRGASIAELQAAGRMWVLSELRVVMERLPEIDGEMSVETWGSRRMGGAR
jgi:acyl-ACP thioesterase